MTMKMICLIREGASASGCRSWCQNAIERGIPGLERLVFNEVEPVDIRNGSTAPLPFVAVVEAWFGTIEEARRLAGSIAQEWAAVNLFVEQRLVFDSGIRPLPSKIMVTLKGLAGRGREAAQRHWATQHVDIGLIQHNATDFLRLYFQNHVRETNQPAGSRFDYDGMPEYWVDQNDLASVGAESTVMKAIAEDELLFIETSDIVTLLLREEELFARSARASGWPVSPDAGKVFIPQMS
jgi:hypothetical protein